MEKEQELKAHLYVYFQACMMGNAFSGCFLIDILPMGGYWGCLPFDSVDAEFLCVSLSLLFLASFL